MKTLFQMTNRMVRSRQFIEPGLGVSTYLDFGARLFSTQWLPYGAHISQGLLINYKGACITAPATPGLLIILARDFFRLTSLSSTRGRGLLL